MESWIWKTDDTEHLEAFSDADWSGDLIDRKSTSGEYSRLGRRRCENSRKVTVARRGQAERAGITPVATTAEALHLQRLLYFLGVPIKLR